MTLFKSDRLFLIPFNKHFSEEERDLTLKTLFKEEHSKSAILNFMLKDYRMLKEEELNPPAIVKEATDEYGKESDKIAQFVEEYLEKNESSEVRTSQIYTLYSKWSKDNGYFPYSSQVLNAKLRKFGKVERTPFTAMASTK